MFASLISTFKDRLVIIAFGILGGLLAASIMLNAYQHGQVTQYQQDAEDARTQCLKHEATVAKASYEKATEIANAAAAQREKTLQDRIDLYSTLVKQSNAENAKLTKRMDNATRIINEIRRHDKSVDTLFSTPIPASLRDNQQLRHDEGG